MAAIGLILLLFVTELSLYMQVETSDRLFVDISRGEKLRINFDVTFPHIPCSSTTAALCTTSCAHFLHHHSCYLWS
jgi:hypothetical protein